MVELLNESACKINFIGKTANNHPDWYKTPLRLNEKERDNPRLILEEFFQSYHLNDVREILWGWTVAVVSSPNSISSDHLDRNNHFFFYEKIEQLIEACWMIHYTEEQQKKVPVL
ncbi:hypothetical protein FAM09_24655 [Niastella caeni]|uniref:Uncharacterized protein n=1 Tax=Niastella caeni TaxID=2569763 RepID=A0A4S8HGV9_9BACT|nr:hypothetical protein [Niastella caeni]THU34213.1 hypothetical protein FAM09_24655 [Niastella caeni]